MENLLIKCVKMSEEEYNEFLSNFEKEQQEIIKNAVFYFKMMNNHNFYKAVQETVGKMVYERNNNK